MKETPVSLTGGAPRLPHGTRQDATRPAPGTAKAERPAPGSMEALAREVSNAASGIRDPWRRALRASLGPEGAPPPLPARTRRGIALHTVHPFLFRPSFPEVPRQTVFDLALSDRLLTEQLLHYDRTLDRPRDAYPGLLYLAQAEQAAALRRLYRLLPPGHPFWDFFFQCHEETWRSVQEEWLEQCSGRGPLSVAHCLRLARGKTALLKPCSAALAFLAGRPAERQWICDSLDRHHEGLVLLDDLEDWKEDLLRGNFTFLLARVLHRAGLWEEIERGTPPHLHRIADALYREGEAERHLRRAERCFRAALQASASFPLPLWQALNRRYAHRCRSTRKGIASWRHRKATPAPSGGASGPRRMANPVRVFLHPGVPRRLHRFAAGVTERFRACFPACTPHALTLGHWKGAPAHFCLPGRHPANCAVNLLASRRAAGITVSGNPLRLETVLALVTGARFLLHGPCRTLLEELFVRGLGLAICRQLWPKKPEHAWFRMPAAERQWCRCQEPYLWERVAPFLEATPPAFDPSFPGPSRPPDPLASGPASERIRLFLGIRLHASLAAQQLRPGTARAMEQRPAALIQAVRRSLQP